MFEFFKVDLNPVAGKETIPPELRLSEEERRKLYRILGFLKFGPDVTFEPQKYGKENAAAIWTEEEDFNYHDESWTEYDILIAEKISEEEFRQGIERPVLNQGERFSEFLCSRWNDHKRPAEFREFSLALREETENNPYKWRGHPVAYFSQLADESERCYVWNERYVGELRDWSSAFKKAYWESYTVAYATGIKELPGFYRFVHAAGNDRK